MNGGAARHALSTSLRACRARPRRQRIHGRSDSRQPGPCGTNSARKRDLSTEGSLAMGLFSFFSGNRRKEKKNTKSPKTKQNRKKTALQVERLEDRTLPSCTSISGFVYQDANNNGLFD